MILAEPEVTPYDLKFHLFGVPVRVHPLFWLVSALLGANLEDLQLVLVWIGCVFVSIVVHEMGHALMARVFGAHPWVVLYSMGGLCCGSAERHAWQRFFVLFWGPGAGFLFYGLIVAFLTFVQPEISGIGLITLALLKYINLFWGLVNLLPIWPLDGGQMLNAVFTMARMRQATYWTHVVSLVGGCLVAVFFLSRQQFFPAMFFGYFAFNSYQMLDHLRRSYQSW